MLIHFNNSTFVNRLIILFWWHAVNIWNSSLFGSNLASAEYWIHFRACSDGVHAFELRNSAKNEPILMKSGALWVHCLGMALADFGRDPRISESWRARQIFVLSLAVAKFHEIWTQHVDRCRDESFRNRILNFFQCLATSGPRNSSLIDENSFPNDPSTGCLVSILLPLESIRRHFLRL